MRVMQEGHSSYGYCWIAQEGCYFYVYTMDGKSKSGPYTSYADALEYFSHYCC